MPPGSFSEVYSPRAFLGEGRLFCTGRCFMFWQDGTRALGTAMWGKPLEADIAEMVPFFEVGVAPRFKGHVSFVDGRKLESIDVLAFGKLLAYLNSRRHAWGPNIGKQAILHPGGFTGVVVSGALHVARTPYPFETFETEAQPAFDWCGVGDLAADYEAQLNEVTKVPEVVRLVRGALRDEPKAEVADLAKKLGMSERTLQRRLEEANTSLRDERERLVTQQIEHLLGGTDMDLEAIAAKVGLHSASHLVRRFKETHGTTPGEWRAQRRSCALRSATTAPRSS
ncbi:MAG: helix-turn-helix transcriptional regulator, partial [Myxococcaceae bacterium]|nr:helix-turn-helix transcriptional regulator [Myxococcaceae bacterium]